MDQFDCRRVTVDLAFFERVGGAAGEIGVFRLLHRKGGEDKVLESLGRYRRDILPSNSLVRSNTLMEAILPVRGNGMKLELKLFEGDAIELVLVVMAKPFVDEGEYCPVEFGDKV